MPSVDILIAFFAATAVFAYMPGPSTLYAAARTIAGGKPAGWLAMAGIHVGGYVHVLAAAFGLAVIFKATPFLYVGLKSVGASYIIWLGIQMLCSKTSTRSDDQLKGQQSLKRAFWDSATVEILNPKTAFFYIAFLPQFTDATVGTPIWLQLFILGTIVNIMFSSADAMCVILSAKILALVKGYGSITRWMNRLGGAILVGLGLRLITSHD